MKTVPYLFWALLYILLHSCASKETNSQGTQVFSNPTISQSSLPRFTQNDTGQQVLSWVEEQGKKVILKFAYLKSDATWSATKDVASGENWFVNWADYPSVQAIDENRLVAHWLQMRDTGTYDYDIMLSHSLDKGNQWSEPIVLHNDSVATEHGFVSAIVKKGEVHFAWLDGREMKQEEPMHIRYAKMNSSFEITDRSLIDERVCECCQTDIVSHQDKAFVVYRDRSEKEIRNISFWNGQDHQFVHDDNWLIGGCPVNGPSVATNGTDIAAAWYTMIENKATIYLSFYDNDAHQFNTPITLCDDFPLGRIDIKWIDQEHVAIVFLKTIKDQANIMLQIRAKNGALIKEQALAETSSKRNSGFPSILVLNNDLFIAFTNVSEGKSVQLKKFNLL